MNKYLQPVFYDFKRSFIRISTLMLLTIFIVSGIGLAYLTYIQLSRYRSMVNLMAVAIYQNQTCLFSGLIHDIKGNLVDNAVFKIIDNKNSKVIYTKVLSKYFEYYGEDICRLLNETLEGSPFNYRIELESSVGTGSIGVVIRDLIQNGYFFAIGDFSKITIYSMESLSNEKGLLPTTVSPEIRAIVLFNSIYLERYRARFILLGFDFKNPGFKPNITIQYTYVNLTREANLPVSIDYLNMSFNYVLTIINETRYKIVDLDLNEKYNVIVFKASTDNAIGLSYSNYGYGSTVQAESISLLVSNVGLGLFAGFFPIVFLYLAYTLLAKPRSTGALEFVLARPVTRWDIYLTRYLAGVLTAIVSTTVFLLTMNLSYTVLFGFTLDLYSNLLLYIGLIASLVVFYTLCYTIASSLKSGHYLAVSIMLFLLFSIFWEVLIAIITFALGSPSFTKIIENSYRLSYFNPLSPTDWAIYYVQKHYGVEFIPVTGELDIDKILNPYLVIASPIIWIIVCFTIGYIVFRKRVITY